VTRSQESVSCTQLALAFRVSSSFPTVGRHQGGKRFRPTGAGASKLEEEIMMIIPVRKIDLSGLPRWFVAIFIVIYCAAFLSLLASMVYVAWSIL